MHTSLYHSSQDINACTVLTTLDSNVSASSSSPHPRTTQVAVLVAIANQMSWKKPYIPKYC